MKITYTHVAMAAIVATIVILVSGPLATAIREADAACNTNKALVNAWNRRTDLQKAFPAGPVCNQQLVEWAHTYGWKEDPALTDYRPGAQQEKEQKQAYDSLLAKLQNVIARITGLESRLTALTSRVAALESEPDTKQPEPAPSMPDGEWRRCIAYDGTGYVWCSNRVQNLPEEEWKDRQEDKRPYEFYIYTRE